MDFARHEPQYTPRIFLYDVITVITVRKDYDIYHRDICFNFLKAENRIKINFLIAVKTVVFFVMFKKLRNWKIGYIVKR